MNSGKVIRFCLIALPAGLFLLGLASVTYTHLMGRPLANDDDTTERKMMAGKFLRKDVNRTDLERYVTVLSEDIGERHVGKYDALNTAALFIESSMGYSNMGYAVEHQEYEVDGQKVWNVIAELRGGRAAEDYLIVGAHYDSIPGSPAANDNATGVAALLALANSFSGMEGELDRSIQFVAFVNEEPPYFQTPDMGSFRYAKRLKGRVVNVLAMMSLETIGFYSDAEGSQKYPPGLEGQFPATGNFLGFVGNTDSRNILNQARSAFMEASDLPAVAAALPNADTIQGAGWSDHWSFWQHGYPAFMVTDTALFRYPHYHQPTDTVDKIDFEKFTEVVKGLRASIVALATE